MCQGLVTSGLDPHLAILSQEQALFTSHARHAM